MQNQMEQIKQYLEELINIPSPVGYTGQCMRYLDDFIKAFDYPITYTNKKAIIVTIPGIDDANQKLVNAHIDTLGAVVKEIKDNGRLRLINTGGYAWGAYEGEYLTIHTHSGKTYSGTLLPTKASVHIYGDEVRNDPRNAQTMEVRIDEPVDSKADVEALGICVGDMVSYQPKLRFLENGYIKSRYLDDKACVAIMMATIQHFHQNQLVPKHTTQFYFSNYEEIGHGISQIPDQTREILSLDIGVVGADQESSEMAVSIAAKDSRSPYSYGFNRRLIELCQRHDIAYKVDVYNKYGSDAVASVLQGADLEFACIGLGVDATHHVERCHEQGLLANAQLLKYYLLEDTIPDNHSL